MEKRDDYYIPEEIAEWIGLKKSEYLSKLIMQVEPDDFGFERYHEFNELIPGTIETPDKVLEGEEDGQKVRTYIRSYNQVEIFHQVVMGVVVTDKNTSSEVFVPILPFVTKKDDLVRLFSVGQVVSRPTLN
ncbi:hypothetical protein [Peredibacter starrii]|uniref:Transposase n=1 Tax=Peredibacter starrii TaxID=28202 RepID=A0AAX4HIX0_9BACT|nr:hypothetical protein [Peredibacter starrii]WPU63182.1 hypothetical protein SOO65_10845 [Peredibacter starrii]